MAKSRTGMYWDKLINSNSGTVNNNISPREAVMTAKTGKSYAGSTMTISDDDLWTKRGFLGAAYQKMETDRQAGTQMLSLYNDLIHDPTSRLYNQYSQPTSNAFNQLKALGFNTALINDDFFDSQDYQSFMAQNLERSDTTGGAKAPSKKSTIQNQWAYYLDKAYGDYQTTKKAKEEYNSMMDTAMYLAGNPAWNYSDQKILSEINRDFDKNYPTLAKMRNSGNTPIGLTEAMDFYEDAMLGAIWAGRNPEYSGNLEGAMANSYLGKGNVWKEDPKISAMLNPEDPSYLPYATGSTNLLKEGQILKRYYYPEEYFDSQEFKDAYYSDDPKKKAAAENVLNAEGNQKAADKAVPAIIGYANYLLTNDHDANSVRGKIDTALAAGKLYVSTDANGNQKFYTKPGKGREEIDLGILNKIDKTVGKTDTDGKRSYPVNDPEELLSFTRGVNYKYDNLIGQVNDICDQYSKQSSGDTYANLNPDNQGVAREKKPFELIEETKSKRAADAMYILDDKLSEMERKNFGALPMPNGTKLAEAFYNVKRGLWGNGEEITGPYDTEKLTNPEWVAKMATRQAEKAEKNFLDTGLSSLQVRTEYEANKKEADKLQAQLDEIENQYGDIILAKQDIPELLNVVIDESTGFSVNLRLEKDKDGNSVYKYHQKDNEDFSLSLPAQEYMNRNNLTEQDVYAAINERAKRSDDNIKLVQDAKKRVFGAKQELTLDDGDGNELDIPFYYNEESGSFDLSPDFNSRDQSVFDFLNNSGYTENELWVEINEYINQLNAELEGPNEEEVNRVTAGLDQLKGQLSATQDEYDKAVKDYDRANSRRARVNDLTLRNSGLYVDPAITDKILSFVGGFTDSKLPEAGYDSLVDDLQSVFCLRELTDEESKSYKENVDELNAHAKDIRFMIDNYNLPDFYKKKMTEEAEYYESRGRLYNAYLITKEDDYESLIKEALDENNELSYDGIAKPYRSGINKTAWGQMTSTERGVYYALSVKQGIEAATQFYQDIEDNLITRARTNIREGVKETAESGFLGRVFNEGASIGSALFEVPLNIAYLIDSAINGEGSKWWRIPSEAAQEAHQAVINELNTIYDGTIWKDIFTGGAEILNNRGRSYAIGGVFGKFMPHIPGEGKMIDAANDIISSFPIATIAFGEAYEDAMENDMEPWQAWTLGTVNFLCESVTEGIKFGNYESLLDGNLTLDTFVDYFADKIAGLDWLEEATGETLNNILERAFNKWVGGDKSEEQKKIQEYIDSGLVSSVEEARAMVMADYVKEDMHTAIISALSSFLDVGMFGAAKLMDTAHYAKELADARRNGDTTSTIRSLRNQDIQQVKMIRDFQDQAEKIRQNRIEEANKPFVPANPANVSESQMQRNQTEYDVDQTILENAADSDQESVTGTIAAVLRISDQNANRANAAAVSFTDRFGEDAVSALQSMLEAGRKAGTNINTLKLGIQYSMLAEGECRQVMESEAYQAAAPEEQAQMLSMATQADANNEAVQATVQEAVHDNRVAEAEKDLFGENEAFELNALQENADEAARKTYIAQEELNDRMEARKAAADNVTSVTMDFLADPSDENKKRKDQAERELAAADAVSKEYEQALNKARDTQTKAENALEQTKDDVMTRIRQQAEEQVAQLEQQEAAAEQEANAALAAAEEERVRIQAEEDARTGKAQEDEDLAKIDEHIQKLGLRGERAEQLRQKAVQTYHDMKTGNMDMSRLLTDAESDLAIHYLSRRLGVAIEVDKEGDPNALPEGRDGKYSNGKITLSHRLTVGQAMLQVAMHEITHSLEKTKSYAKYKDTVFDILFSSPEQREAAIQQKLDMYRLNGVKDFQREDAEREIVADFAMDDKTFANRQTIDRMLDAGLGGKIRNTLHNINQFLKNTKLEGEERVRAENLRKAERLYIKAMNERRNINTHPSSEQFSVNQFAQAAGLFYNEVNITDANGNVIAGPGLYTSDPSVPENNAVKVEKVTPEMMANTPVGMLTNAAQALGTMNAETAGKIHTMFADLMTMCSNLQDTNLVWEIAGSTLYSEFSAIKGNSDKQYSTTVDFGTICTKTQAVINQLSRDMLRLGRGLTSQEILDVYNDVYQADLKVPCPVCYVFSRWLGVPSLLENIRQYQNRFLGEEGENLSKEEVQARVDAFIEKAHSEDFSIDEKFIEAQAKARQNALNKIDRIQNGRDGIAKTEAKIAKYRDKLAEKPDGNTRRYLASAEKKLAKLQEDLAQAKTDYDNSDIAAYAKVINKKKAELESKIKDKLIKIEGDDRGTRGINDDIRDAIKEGKPTDKLEEKRRSLYAEIDDLNVKLREVDAYNWVTQALCRLDENGRFVVDDAFKRTKNEVLLDLNRTGEFAKDVKNWTYRSTRGAGMGKAILPYSGAKIGDSVLGTGARTMANPYEDGDSEGAFNALKSSIIKAYRQNLIGGQRFQSTSDFRPEWGLDYIMTFIEQQAIGSRGQLYTKVNEAVPLYASVGIDTNCSIMPYANGWHDPAEGEIEAMSDTERKSRVVTFKGENGEERTVVLDFSDVTGMKYDAARLLSKSYDNVQMIMVGINDIHIRACLAGEEIDFVIPWHASGNTKSQLQNMMQTVNETLTNSSDYTKVQSDQIADKKALEAAHGKQERDEDLTAYERELIHKEQMRDARTRLLTGKTLTATDMERIKESQFLTSLYERFEGKTLDGKELPHNPEYWIELPGMEAERVKMTSSQAEQIFPYEYWDTTLTKDQADENGWRFVQYCQELGLVPRFSGGNQKDEKTGEVTRFGNFSGAVYDDNGNITGYDREQMAKGYWKTLIDRKMYDNNGNYRSQQQIDASKVRAGDLTQTDEGRIHTRSNIPDSISGANYRGEEAEAKYRQADQALKDRLAEKAANGDQKTREQAQADLERINAWETAHANDHEQYRVTPEINPYEDMTTGEMMQLLTDAGVDYMEGFGELNPEAISSDYTDSDGDPVTNEAVEVSDVKTQYSIRRFAPPEKTITCYKAFYARDGKLYPPMVSNNTNAEDIQKGTKLTSGTMRGLETPVGVWLDADVGGLAVDENGEPLRTATTNRLRVKNDKGGDSLAFRPGWHLGEWPDATQFYKTDPVTGEKKSVMPDDLVFAECEIAADKDYQMEAFELGMTENGKFNRSQAGLPRVPVDGYYKYRTNANPKEAPWYISGAMKVNRILTDEECREICAKHGVTPGERYSHHDINLEDYGLKAGPVVQTENLERFEKNQASYDNDALLERALNDERYRGAYVRRTLNFDDERLRNEFRIDRISDEQYENYRNEYTAPEEQWSINDNNNPEMTSAEMLQLLRDAGVYQQEEAPTNYEATGPQRQFGSETVQNAEGVSQKVKNWLKMHSDYNPDTNDAQINRAVKWVMDKRSSTDPEGFWSALEDVENKNFNPLTADGQAKMYVLMSMASNKNDLNVQLRLADAINKQGTTLGQALQSRRLYRLMTPEGRLSILQKEVDRVNSELKRKGKEGNVTLSDWILRSAAAAQTEEEFAKARQAMWEELGSQLPVSWWDRFQAWRMVSMLGNPRTHLRNVVGNAMFVPAVTAKNKIGAALESIFVDEGERTKALRTDKAALEYAEADADRMQSKLTGEAKYSDANQIQRNKKPFGKSFLGKIAQGASDFSSDMLEKEDWIFLRYHYKNALAGWMTANKVTGEQLESDTELLDKARTYAIEEAQKATYRDANALAEWLGKGDKIPGVRLLTTSVLPFKKTPMNILKRGLEYSPLGFLKNITADVVRLVEYQKWANGEKAEKADWALSPAQFIDKLSSGITGLGIAGIGAFMKSMGWLTLGFKKDEPEDEFRKARGEQEYALHINLFGQDITYTIDWSAPSCMPLFVGATIQDAVERSGNLDLGETLMGLGSVTEPIWNLSMLDGLNSLFETSQYEDGNVATQILMKVGLNYANSFIPTMVGQLSRTIDPARRKSYVQSGSKPSAAYYTFEQMQNKTPWSVYNIPYRDVRGNEDRRSWVQRLLENFISPGYYQSSAEDSTLNELERLYKDNTGNESVQPSELKKLVPQNADKSFTVKNETIRLTDQQYDQMDVERKQYAFDLMDKLIADPYYASVDDTARIDMINDIWTYATQQARYNQFPQVTREDWITRAQKNNIDMLDVIKKRSEDQIKQDSIDGWSNALVDSIKAGNQDDIETAIGTLELHDLDEDDISKIVKNGFSKDYVKAYKDDDEDEMNAIESMLYDAGFEYDYESWLDTTVKNEEKWLEDYNQ